MFKLILGLGNKDLESSLKVINTYMKKGVDIIDVSAPLIYEIKNSSSSEIINKVTFCVSLALTGDVHNKKVKINNNCTLCKKCINACSQNAINYFANSLRIKQDKCVGCMHCKKLCKHNAIDVYEQNSFKDDIEIIKKLNVDMVELHLSIKKKKEIIRSFEYLLNNYKGDISCCLSRKYLSTVKAIKLIAKLKELFYQYNKNKNFYIQLDGSSINNGNDEYKTNLEALAFYNEVKNEIQDIPIILSGGLNSKTIELCKLFNLKPYGLAFGGYARKIADNKSKVDIFIKEIKEFYSEK